MKVTQMMLEDANLTLILTRSKDSIGYRAIFAPGTDSPEAGKTISGWVENMTSQNTAADEIWADVFPSVTLCVPVTQPLPEPYSDIHNAVGLLFPDR